MKVKVELKNGISAFSFYCEPVGWEPDRKEQIIYYLEDNPNFVDTKNDIILTDIENLAHDCGILSYTPLIKN